MGGSVDGGREEFEEFWPSRASSSRTCARRLVISAWAAHGVAAQIAGGRGRAVNSIDLVYGATARGATRRYPGA